MAGDTRDEYRRSILGLLSKVGLPSFTIDTVTPGDGSCFMTGTLQQIRRNSETYSHHVRALKGQYDLRKAVKEFVNRNSHPVLKDWKSRFFSATGKTWNYYWSENWMLRRASRTRGSWEWADGPFIQFTAWYIVRDILIISDFSTVEKPWTKISGNIDNETIPCNGPPVFLVFINGNHYQSVMPNYDQNREKEEKEKEEEQEEQEEEDQAQEVDGGEEEATVEEAMQDKIVTRCPACQKECKEVLKHIVRARDCMAKIGKDKYEEMRLLNSKLKNRKRVHDCTKRQKDRDPDGYKEKRSKINKDYVERKDPDKVKENNRNRKQKSRNNFGQDTRLKDFLLSTQHGPDFICISCHQRIFRSNVTEFSKSIQEELMRRMNLYDFIENINLYSNVLLSPPELGGHRSRFICLTCLKYLRKKKLPPCSVKNSLKLHETDDSLEAQGLHLTELEGNLIAKRIIYQKIILLPRSRWTALKDKQVNIPITDESLNKTLIQLPRTPHQAGLIGVALKKKMEYKSSHFHQLIDPQKLFRMIDKLQLSGNPYYQDVHSFETYQRACLEENDPDGYELVFGKNDKKSKVQKLIPQASKTNEEVIDEILQKAFQEEEQNDPIKKFQFEYDQSVALSDKYPEISVAPGEGQRPTSVLMDENWEIQAFPWLHNADGSNGKDFQRKVKLTAQRYFISRITNLEQRFARCSAYLYAATGFLEQMQINRNINLVGTRGKMVAGPDGQISYEINDEFKALEGMKNTPKYWQKMKYEFVAKLDNFGPFQFFFTLSCADMRWNSCVGSVLASRGYSIFSEVVKDDHDNWTTQVKVMDSHGNWKHLDDFLEDDVEVSLHELIRNNVVLATRYFNHRLKSFIRTIVTAKSNPMCTKFYSYKIEFQERGAAHAHGVIWVDFERLEKKVKSEDGKHLVDPKLSSSTEAPLAGIAKVFRKLRNSQDLTEGEFQCLTTFVDVFTTVSTDYRADGGEDVARIAVEVNKHRHTKTCRKYGDQCRFGFPKFPIDETLIAQALKKEGKEKAKVLQKNSEVLKKVRDVLENEEEMNEIMEKYPKNNDESKYSYKEGKRKRIHLLLQKAKVHYKDYISALSTTSKGYTVVLARDIDEVFINSYNPEWLRAWNGNMDLQICLDFHSVITYITDYYSKDDSGTMEVIKTVLREEQPETVKEKMKTVGNVFLTHRQMGNAEAVFKLIPSMNLSNSNVTCQWVSLGTKEERSSRWILAGKEQTDSGIPLVKLKNHEGLWFEQQDMVSKYHRRPEELTDMCLAHFAKMYRGARDSSNKFLKLTESEDEGDEEDNQGKDVCDDKSKYPVNEVPSNEKFDYVMTYRNNGKEGQRLPDKIQLRNSCPGEVSIMIKRTHPAALRYHKSKKAKDFQKYMFDQVMLFHPHHHDLDVDLVKSIFEESYDGKRKVEIVKSQVMEYLEDVEEARYYAELANVKLDLEETAQMMDAGGEQDNAECADEEDVEDPEYEHINPELLNLESIKSANNIYKKISLPTDEEMKKSSRNLDVHQRRVLDAVVKLCKDLVKARKVHNKRPKPLFIMVHGGAGAGKSTSIRNISHWSHKIISQEGDNPDYPIVIKTAFCGTAAANIDGQTLHSAFGFSFKNKFYSLSDKQRDIRREILKRLILIIIDEISMVKADMLYQLDLRLQEIMEMIGVPFGGVSLIVFGDMMQLRPCQGKFIFEEPKNEEFLATHQISPRWQMFQSIVLEKNHRQGKDKSYAELLNRLRIGKHTDEDLKTLRTRVRKRSHGDLKNVDLFITGTRKECANINLMYIAKMKGAPLSLKAIHYHETRKSYKPYISKKDLTVADTGFMDELILKIDAKVMLIYNIKTVDGLTNGQLGVLKEALRNKDGKIEMLVVKFNNSNVGLQNREENPGLAKKFPGCSFISRVSLQYSLRKNASEISSTATVIQFPLKLAHGTTTHKIQGQSILFPSKVAMDINSTFQPAQAYVMLSRVQCLDQVYIIDSLDEKKISVAKVALDEVDRLDSISVNRNPTPWMDNKPDLLRIASLNCAGLQAHYEDLLADSLLLTSSVLLLQETSLEIETSISEYPLPEFLNVLNHPIGRGKGICTFSKDIFINGKCSDCDNLQVDKICHSKIDIINVYRSSNGNKYDLVEALDRMINARRLTLIAGDFNICLKRDGRNVVSEFLKRKGFTQLVTEATHIAGGLLDHVYINNKDCVIKIERHSPYYSDHDANLITLNI